MSLKYFGTDGIRGCVGYAPIDVNFMLKLGWSIGQVFAKEKEARILIGRDTRVSGCALQAALQAGVAAAGVDVNLLGVVPTPAVAYLTHSVRAQAGIMISASHNLYQDNGVKFFDHAGMKLSDELEHEIESYMDKPFHMVTSDSIGVVRDLVDAKGRYIEFCKSIFPSQLSLNSLKLVVDCAHGATFLVAPKIFHELGAKVIAMANSPDGYNINDQCGSTDVRALQQKVMEVQADAGIALDGDGDRLIMVDNQGKVLDGDDILFILAKQSSTGFSSRAGVVGTVMSNLGLEQALNSYGVAFKRAHVGDRFVLEEMMASGWALGGEPSGHIIDLDYTTTGDGIVSALQVLRVMQMSGDSLATLAKGLHKRPQILINVPVTGQVDLCRYPKISHAVSEVQRDLGKKGRVLLRLSGTESCVRVMVEGDDESIIRQKAERLAEVVRDEVVLA